VRFSKDPRLHQRGTAIAVLARQGMCFAVAGTHLDLAAQPRLRHVGELEAALAVHVPAGIPTVIGGDINDRPGSAPWTALATGRADAFAVAGVGGGFTYSAREPRRTIDGIFADPAFRVRTAYAVDGADVGAASDHRPLLAELEF
jgi:endonuclease/exonuclease/phosphatase family metal-dependent hydrolase